jgi:hypothetical protein
MTSMASGKDFGSAKRKILTEGLDFSKTRTNSDLNRAEVTFPGGSLALFHIPGNTNTAKTTEKRKNPILMKTKIRNSMCGLFLISLLLACFALLPRVQAAPDPAAIPGGNTRDGAGSLAHRTTGQFNTAFGTNALFTLTTGSNNAAQGNSALFTNNGNGNVAVGNAALRFNTDGFQNTAVGGNALNSNVHGPRNAALGYSALRSNTGTDNTAVGWQALVSNLGGEVNTAVGVNALASSETANANTALGWQALFQAIGSDNIALGAGAGSNLTDGNNNIEIGNDGNAGDSATIRIGVNSGTGLQTATYIAGIYGRNVSAATDTPVIIDSSGKLGTMTSSQRFKKDIKPMDQASDAILRLKPVTFHYKSDPSGFPRFGLVAEDVAEVSPDLIVRDADGQILTVRYEAVNAMLLNEFLKEHRKNEEQEKTIAELKSGMTALIATVKEQAAQIQKVSAQIEVTKPAPQVVDNTP